MEKKEDNFECLSPSILYEEDLNEEYDAYMYGTIKQEMKDKRDKEIEKESNKYKNRNENQKKLIYTEKMYKLKRDYYQQKIILKRMLKKPTKKDKRKLHKNFIITWELETYKRKNKHPDFNGLLKWNEERNKKIRNKTEIN